MAAAWAMHTTASRESAMKEKRAIAYFAAAIANVAAFVVVNTEPLWRAWARGVVLNTWVDIVWAANLSIGVQIVGNLILTSYRPRWFTALMRLLFDATGFISAVVFLTIFPLDFSRLVGGWMNVLVEVALLIGICGTAIAMAVELVRLVTALGQLRLHPTEHHS
jgi:hypothetical protein